MELKDQILQTKERKKGFLNAMPEDTRKQIGIYTKLDKVAKRFWIIIVASLIISGAVYLAACFAATPENRFVVHAILAGLWVAAGIVLAFWIRSLAVKGKKAIGLGAPDYVEELNAINSRLAGLEKAEKQRVAAEKEEAKAKARAEAAQRKADEALQRQQAAVQATAPQPTPPSVTNYSPMATAPTSAMMPNWPWPPSPTSATRPSPARSRSTPIRPPTSRTRPPARAARSPRRRRFPLPGDRPTAAQCPFRTGPAPKPSARRPPGTSSPRRSPTREERHSTASSRRTASTPPGPTRSSPTPPHAARALFRRP